MYHPSVLYNGQMLWFDGRSFHMLFRVTSIVPDLLLPAVAESHVHILCAYMCTFASWEVHACVAVTLTWDDFYDFEHLAVSLYEC